MTMRGLRWISASASLNRWAAPKKNDPAISKTSVPGGRTTSGFSA
jgi:hypothetical protein